MAEQPEEQKVSLSKEADDVDKTDVGDSVAEEAVEDRDRPSVIRLPNPFGRLSRVGRALVAAALVVAALTGLTGWLGYRDYAQHRAQAQRELFIRAARQGAVNLTTLDYTQIDTDVQRIIDLATGAFRDDFERRSKPFVELVKVAQSKSEGTVTDAGLESQRGDSAQVLVAVAVKSRTAAGEEAPREWRMRIEVQAVGDEAKMSNVVFVP